MENDGLQIFPTPVTMVTVKNQYCRCCYEKNHVSGSNRPILLIFVSIIGFNKISDRLEYDSLRSGIKIMSKTGFAPLAEDRYHYILRVFLKKIMYTQKYRQYNSAQEFMNVFLP